MNRPSAIQPWMFIGIFALAALLFWLRPKPSPPSPHLVEKQTRFEPEMESDATASPGIELPLADSVPPPEWSAEAVAELVAARMLDWETAPSQEADAIEAELRALINGTNAALVVQRLPAKFQTTYLGLLALEQWANTNRASALQWLAGREEVTSFQAATVTRDWMKKDGDQLREYVNQLPAGKGRDQLLGAMAQETLYGFKPEVGFALSKEMVSGDEQVRLLQDAAVKWSECDASAVVEQLNQILDAGVQARIIPYVAIGHATRYPALAADWLLQTLNPGADLDFGLSGVFQVWLDQEDASIAAEWVETTPESRREPARQILANVLRRMTGE
jgi:hypothetical protein